MQGGHACATIALRAHACAVQVYCGCVMVEWAGATLIIADASVEGMARCMETGGNGDDVMGWPGVFEGIQRYRL